MSYANTFPRTPHLTLILRIVTHQVLVRQLQHRHLTAVLPVRLRCDGLHFFRRPFE